MRTTNQQQALRVTLNIAAKFPTTAEFMVQVGDNAFLCQDYSDKENAVEVLYRSSMILLIDEEAYKDYGFTRKTAEKILEIMKQAI